MWECRCVFFAGNFGTQIFVDTKKPGVQREISLTVQLPRGRPLSWNMIKYMGTDEFFRFLRRGDDSFGLFWVICSTFVRRCFLLFFSFKETSMTLCAKWILWYFTYVLYSLYSNFFKFVKTHHLLGHEKFFFQPEMQRICLQPPGTW